MICLQREIRRRKEEEEKWKNVPEWKRKILIEKEQEKRQKETDAERQVIW